MSTQIDSRDNRHNNWFIKKAIPIGVVSTAAEIGVGAFFLDKNQKDSFVSTLKNTAKDYANDGRLDLKWILDKLKLEKAGKYIEKLSNKKMFALAAGATVFINAQLAQAVHTIFSKKSKKN